MLHEKRILSLPILDANKEPIGIVNVFDILLYTVFFLALQVESNQVPDSDLEMMAVKVIGKGQRREVFKAIYFGKRNSKTAAEIAEATGLTQKRVTEHGKALARRHIVTQINDRGISYEKVEALGAPRIISATIVGRRRPTMMSEPEFAAARMASHLLSATAEVSMRL